MKKVILNIIGTPRIFINKNAENIFEKIIKTNPDYEFHIYIHTSSEYIATTHKKNLDDKKKLQYQNQSELHKILYNVYSKLSNYIKIIIEPIDFDIGKHHNWKHLLLYLRQHRISKFIENIDTFDYVISIRNDIILNNNLNINNIKNNFYSIIGPGGGFKGYANGDFDFCFIYNINNYKVFCNCIEFLWEYKTNIYYSTKNLKYITPIFEKKYPFLDENYYNTLGRNFNKELIDPNVNRFQLALSEVFINHLTNFLIEINSYWDVTTFSHIGTKLLEIK